MPPHAGHARDGKRAESEKAGFEMARTVSFVPNRGQAPADILWQAEGKGFEASFRRDGFVLRLYDAAPSAAKGVSGQLTTPVAATPAPFHVRAIEQSISVVGMSPESKLEPLDLQPGKINFFHGNDPARWVRGLETYARLRYKNVYPGIDLLFYGNHGALEYDFVVNPGVDPGQIRLRLDPGTPSEITESGELRVGEGSDAVRHRPLLYQNVGTGKHLIEGKFIQIAGDTLGFRFSHYDAGKTLVIDPTLSLLYSTYLGGRYDDEALAATVDAQGNSYILGFSSSHEFPVTGNAFQSDRKIPGETASITNMVIVKIDAAGTLLYSTYLGGSTDDAGNGSQGGIAIDSSGNTYITSTTKSPDFPITGNAYQNTYPSGASTSAFFSELSPDGSALLYSSFLGASAAPKPVGISLNPQGNVVVAGTAGTGLPTTPTAYLKQISTGTAAFVSVFNLALSGTSQLVASSYYGSSTPIANPFGTGNLALAMALDSSGNPWIGGQSYTNNLPLTGNAYQSSVPSIDANCLLGHPLNSVGYFAKLSANLTTLVYASYLSGLSADTGCSEYVHAIALDGSGNVYLGGVTGSAAFPTTSGVFQPMALGSGFAEFVAKVNPTGALVWSTYLGSGGAGNSFLSSLALDTQKNVWVCGTTQGGPNFPLENAYQATLGGGYDGHVTQIKGDGTAVLYSTYLGGAVTDVAVAIALDPQNNVYIAGSTTSLNFPVTANAFQPLFGNGYFAGSGINDIFFTVLGAGVIGTIGPLSGSNTGDTTVTVTGAGIQASATCALDGSTTIQATAVSVSSDGTSMTCTFSLNGVATGQYSLVVSNPGGNSIISNQAFQVSTGTGPQIQTNVATRALMRFGVPTAATLEITNTGDTDAYFTRVFVAIPSDVVLSFPNPIRDPFPQDNDTTTDYSLYVNGFPDTDGNTYYSFSVPQLPPGATSTLQFQLTVPDTEASFEISTYSHTPWFSELSQTQTALNNLVANPGAISPTCIVTPSPTLRDCSGAYVNDMASGVVDELVNDGASIGDPNQAQLTMISFIAGRLAWLLQPGALMSPSARPEMLRDRGGAAKSSSKPRDFVPVHVAVAFGAEPDDSWQAMAAVNGPQHINDPKLKACDPNPATVTKVYLTKCSCGAKTRTIQLTANCDNVPPPTYTWTSWEYCPGKEPKGVAKTCAATGTMPPHLRPKVKAADLVFCPNPEDNQDGTSTSISCPAAASSQDPNDKCGPSGDGSSFQYVTGTTPLTYNIAFENEATAALPAAQVVVTDPLDPTKVNLATVTLGTILFGTNVINLPNGSNNFNTTFNISTSLSVRIQGSVNVDTGLLKWTFTSIDPTTGLPPSDPTVGFLPPDANGVEGQGSVVFTVMPKAGLTTGAQIKNQASVVFDANAPISTATWLNTLDVTPPQSSVTALPSQESQTSFSVAWSGTDVGSGIGSYSIYVSDNGAPFTVFENSATATSAQFAGQPGHTYGFYSRAIDAAGNLEASKSVADTMTSVAGGSTSPTTTTAMSIPTTFNPAAHMITLNATVTSMAGTVNAGTVMFTLLGSTVQGAVSSGSATASFTVPASEAVGNYTIQAAYSGATGFAGGSDNTKLLSIGKATPVLTWPAPAAIQFGRALGAGQLDATANVPGTFVYNPPAGTVLSAGNQALAVTFTPADSLDYASTNRSVAINVLVPLPDFNGDGKADVYLYDPIGGNGFAGLSNGSGTFTYVSTPFTPGFDVVRYGSLNNDAFTDLIVYNSTTAIGYALLGTGTGTFNAISLFWGPGFKTVAAGDLNGDGYTDFVIYRPSDGTMYSAISNGDGTFHYQYTLVSLGFTNLQVADFNGDGKADVFFYRASDGVAFVGISNGTGGFTFSPVTVGGGYDFIETGDVNGDGKADLLFYSSSTGAAYIGTSTGSGFTFSPLVTSAGFTSVHSDLVRNRAAGATRASAALAPGHPAERLVECRESPPCSGIDGIDGNSSVEVSSLAMRNNQRQWRRRSRRLEFAIPCCNCAWAAAGRTSLSIITSAIVMTMNASIKLVVCLELWLSS